MQYSTKNETAPKLQQQTISFDQLLAPVFKHWYLFVLSIAICVVAALVYLRYATPIYEVQTTLLLRNNEKNGLTRDALQKELLGMGSESKVYEDMRILKSRTLMQQVVDSLNLQHQLVRAEGFVRKDLHQNSPIDLVKSTMPSHSKDYGLKILNPTEYQLQVNEEELLVGTFGTTLNTGDGNFFLHLKEETLPNLDTAANYILQTNSLDGSTKVYSKAFFVKYDKDQPTLLDVYFRDEVPERGLEVLHEVIEAYNRITLNDKSRNRKNTLNFIDERIALLAKELNQVERELERYKSKEKLTVDYKADLPYVQERIGYFEREIVNVEIQQNMMQYIATTLNNGEYQFFPLVDFGIEHKGLSGLIMEYNGLVQEKNKLRKTATDNYPTVKLIEEQLANLKISIQEEVDKNQRDLVGSLVELKNKSEEYIAQLNATPRRERELVDKQRQQLIKENLYKFLLEKREEAAISIAAVAENASIIDAPFLAGKVFPKSNSILLGAILGGFFFPLGLLLLFGLFDKRLRHQEEWSANTQVPVLGSIVRTRNRSKNKLAIQANNHSPTAESFRSLRTNLNFFLENKKNQLILVTSTSIEEGKSFTTINLGMSYALAGKKVLLMDFDLYNPKMMKYLTLSDPSLGISDYLTGEASIAAITNSYEGNDYLHYISSGSLAQNPSELLTSYRLPILLEELKKQYDIILLDSPAAGLVSDSLVLSKYANASLYIARVGVTEREDLQLIERLHKEGKLIKPALVFNGIKKGKIYKRALKKGYYVNSTH